MADDYCELCDLPRSQCIHGMPPPPEPAPKKKRQAAASAEHRVLLMELQVGDRLTDETGDRVASSGIAFNTRRFTLGCLRHVLVNDTNDRSPAPRSSGCACHGRTCVLVEETEVAIWASSFIRRAGDFLKAFVVHTLLPNRSLQ